jgi:hypothetical protein
MKKIVACYKSPTPSWALKTEAGMFIAGNFITGNALLSAHPVIGMIGVGLTLGSKLMNLFTDDEANK